jgi:hypothetical protein
MAGIRAPLRRFRSGVRSALVTPQSRVRTQEMRGQVRKLTGITYTPPYPCCGDVVRLNQGRSEFQPRSAG